MADGIGPLGQLPLSRYPFSPGRLSPGPAGDEGGARLDATERSGTRDGFMVDAGRRIDAFAASAELTEDQAQKFDAASEGFLKAVASIRSERLGSLQTAQRTQLALEDFGLALDRLQLPGGAQQLGVALTALVGELQQVFDAAFDGPAGDERTPQIFFPRFDGHAAPAERLLGRYRADAGGRGLPPDASIDGVA